MKYSSFKFSKNKPRYRIKNIARFVAVGLVFLLTLLAVFVMLKKIKNSDKDDYGLKPIETIDASTPNQEPIPEPTPEPTPTPFPVPEGKKMESFLVVIDPGHGGLDGGTWLESKGVMEKNIVFDISKRVKKMLDDKGINSMLTREIDQQLVVNDSEADLVARWSLANEQKASLFVSIHVNAYDLKYKGAAGVKGMEIYYFEDKHEVYTDFTQQRFAEIMRDSVTAANGMTFRFMEGGIRLAVVRNTTMPAVLIETAYITNAGDFERLISDEFKENTARGIVDGIEAAMAEIGVFEYDQEMYVFKEIGE